MTEFGHISDGRGVTLSEETYHKINEGMDIRKVMREDETDERQVRAQAAIMIIMYDCYPLAVTGEEVWNRINEMPYHLMNDEEFRAYCTAVILAKRN